MYSPLQTFTIGRDAELSLNYTPRIRSSQSSEGDKPKGYIFLLLSLFCNAWKKDLQFFIDDRKT